MLPIIICRRAAVLAAAIALLATAERAAAADVVFLQDGTTIAVDKVEVMADRVRIQRAGSGEIIDLPRHSVLSVHAAAPPPAGPGSPAATYPNFVQQMTDAVRGQLATGTPSTPLSPYPR
jgi:hypothetical protein